MKTIKRAIFAIACAVGSVNSANAQTEQRPLIVPERGAKYQLTKRSAELFQLDYGAVGFHLI